MSMPAADKGYIGNDTYTRGNVPNGSPPEGPPYGKFVKTGIAQGSTLVGVGFMSLGNAAGAIWSTGQDMAKWYRTLLTQPQKLGLDASTLKQMLSISTPVWYPGEFWKTQASKLGIRYAQGVVVTADKTNKRLGVSTLYYLGSAGAFQALIYYNVHPTDPKQDVFLSIVATTILDMGSVASNYKFEKGGCVFRANLGGKAVSGPADMLLCSVTDPKKPFRNMPDLILNTALNNITGAGIWGLK
eukprot:jgi/Chrzof1/9008/Cz03g32210.t1